MYKSLAFGWLLSLMLTVGSSDALAGCEKTEGSSVDKEAISEKEKVGERALARWEALIAGDWDTAYTFETPGYRAFYTVWNMRDSYGGAVTWKGIKLLRTEDVSSTAKVTLELTSSFEDGGLEMLIPVAISEQWLKKDGEWWFVRK